MKDKKGIELSVGHPVRFYYNNRAMIGVVSKINKVLITISYFQENWDILNQKIGISDLRTYIKPTNCEIIQVDKEHMELDLINKFSSNKDMNNALKMHETNPTMGKTCGALSELIEDFINEGNNDATVSLISKE